MHDWRSLVRSTLPRLADDPGRNREILDELAHHLADTYEALRASGLSDEDALARASAELAAMPEAADDLRHAVAPPERVFASGRAARGFTRVSAECGQDVRYAARLLAKSPAYALAIVLTLSLAIGATTAIFSIVERVLLRPLPYPQPERLVRIWEVSPRGDERNVVSSGNYLDWRDRARSFDAIGAHNWPFRATVTGGGDPASVSVSRLTPSVLKALGVEPHLGRLSPNESTDTGQPVMLLSEEFWRQRFSGDPAVIGRTILLNGESFAVTGVMRADFRFPEGETDLWLLEEFGENERAQRRSHNFGVVARLKPGLTIDAAAAEMRSLAAQIAREQPTEMTGWGVNVVGLHSDLVSDTRPLLALLLGVVLVVLLVACANLANLTLARATTRRHELAVRTALGAGRGRLARQLLTETFVLTALGGTLGLAVAWATLPVLIAAAPDSIPLLSEARLDPVVFTFAALLTMVTALLVGLLPAVRAGGADPRSSLQGTRSSASHRQARLRGTLVVVQVALAMVLLVGATLLIRSLIKLAAVDHGFDPDGVLAVRLDIPRGRYPDRGAQSGFYERLLERVTSLPGVSSASTTSGAPGSGASFTFSFAIEGRPAANPNGREDPVTLRAVMPRYFEVMGIPVLRGRAIGAADSANSPPIVLFNATLAKRFWSDDDAIGRRISFVGPQGPWYEVVGVVGDTRDDGLDRPAPPMLYLPFAQKRENWTWLSWQTLVVRARPGLEVSSLLPQIRAAVRDIDPSLPLQTVTTVNQLYAEINARRSFAMELTGGFAALALLLGMIGIYAVVAYSVAQRRREIGIRLALGALPADLGWRIVGGGVALAALGTMLGGAAAVVVTGSLETLLYGVAPTDPTTFFATAVLLGVVSAAASWIPARRAMRVDPVQALRTD